MRKVREGLAEILVPEHSITRKAEAFYNPEMAYQRDITMSALRVWQKMTKEKIKICDPLAGTGVRSVRIGLEVPGIESIVVNDANPKASKLIERNIERNFIGRKIKIEAGNKNANILFLERPREFDFIDIDPFGSPVNFIFNAGYALKPRSLLACTATDTGALCGTFPQTCFSRYGIKAVKTDFFKETGVRVLITAVMFELARHGLAFSPLYSHSNHYFRVIGEVRRSRSMQSSFFKNIRFFSYCKLCLYRSLEMKRKCPNCGKEMEILGPLWTGKIKDSDFCMRMLEDLRSADYRKTKEIEMCAHEIDAFGYYGLPEICKFLKITPRKITDIIADLKSLGHEAGRTHLSPTGVKTDAPYSDVLLAIRDSRR